ncbi:MAG: lysozyme inhibitor LprI family protein [Hyphomicrobiaceae bacterium]|nr:lysozyme inhibitor LprI family protein [Hyphomicrobiaceae bacterium]
MTSRHRAAGAGLLFIACLVASGAPAAATGRNGSVEHAIQACLETARDTGTSRTECIGRASDRCDGLAETGSGQAVADCYDRETVIWDDLLNTYYGALRTLFEKPSADKLRAAQIAWISWRDKRCELPYLVHDGGSMALPMAARCLMETTAQRAIDLGEALDDLQTR